MTPLHSCQILSMDASPYTGLPGIHGIRKRIVIFFGFGPSWQKRKQLFAHFCDFRGFGLKGFIPAIRDSDSWGFFFGKYYSWATTSDFEEFPAHEARRILWEAISVMLQFLLGIRREVDCPGGGRIYSSDPRIWFLDILSENNSCQRIPLINISILLLFVFHPSSLFYVSAKYP